MTESRVTEISEEKHLENDASREEPAARHGRVSSVRKKHQFRSGVLVTDISSGTFKYVLLTRKKGTTVVHNYGNLDKKRLGIVSDDPLDLYRAGLVWVDANSVISTRDILVVSSQLDFFIRELELPLSGKADLERAVGWNIDKQIPIQAEDSYIKVRKGESRNGLTDLTVGVVPRGQVNSWQFLDKKLVGVIPTPVSLVPMGPPALSRELSYCYVFRDNSYLCIGFYNSKGLQFQQQVAAGSLESDLEDGEYYFDPDKIVVELANSVEVFYSHFPDERVAGIVLFMSPEEISRIAPVINENIVIDIFPAEKPENLRMADSCDPENIDYSYYPLLGAARIANDDFIFLPKTLEDNIVVRKIRKLTYYGLTAGIATITLLFMFMVAGANIKKARLNNITAQIENIEDSHAYTISREYLHRTNLLTSLEDRLSRTGSLSSDIFTALEYIAPPKIFLNNVILKSGSPTSDIEISGYYEGDLSESDITILAFMDNLKLSGFREIRLERQGQKLSSNRKIENFEITGKLARNE